MTGIFWLLLFIVAIAVFGGAIFAVGAVVLWYALVGLVIGGLARLLVRGTRGIGLLATVLAGVIGSVGGGWIAHALDVGGVLEFLIAVLVAAVVVGIASSAASGD